MRAVRNANLDDCAAIAAVHVRAWQAVYRGHMPDEFLDRLNVSERTEMWRKLSVKPGRVLLVVDDLDGSISGFCDLIPSRDADAKSTTAEISAIYVSPDKWGQGIGQALLSAAVARAPGDGFSEVNPVGPRCESACPQLLRKVWIYSRWKYERRRSMGRLHYSRGAVPEASGGDVIPGRTDGRQVSYRMNRQ